MPRYKICEGCRSLRIDAKRSAARDRARCEKAHRLRFRMPTSPLDQDWGWFRQGHPTCAAREDAPPPEDTTCPLCKGTGEWHGHVDVMDLYEDDGDEEATP